MRNPTPSLTTVLSPSNNRLRGIMSMIAAVFVFAIMDSLLKRLSSHYGPMQVACLRCFSSLALLTCTIAFQRTWPQLRGGQPMLHLLRGALGIGMLGCFVFAVHRLTMAQTYSLFMIAPLLMTALSVPMHGEVVTARRWCAIAVGMGGVLIILHPWSKGFISFTAAAAAAAATVCYSLSALTVRSLGRRNSNIGTIFWNFTLVGFGSGALALFDWRPVPPSRVALARWRRHRRRARPILDHRCIPARAAIGRGSVRIHLAPMGLRHRLDFLVGLTFRELARRSGRRGCVRHLRHLGRAPLGGPRPDRRESAALSDLRFSRPVGEGP